MDAFYDARPCASMYLCTTVKLAWGLKKHRKLQYKPVKVYLRLNANKNINCLKVKSLIFKITVNKIKQGL